MRSPWTSYIEPSYIEPSYIEPSYIEPSYIEPSYIEPSYIEPRPSAEIRAVEVQKLGTFYDFCWPRATLCGFAWSRFKNSGLFTISAVRARPSAEIVSKRSRCGAVRICLSLGEPSAEIVRVEALSLWRRAIFILARETAFGSCLVVCAPAFAIPRSRVRFPPGPRQLRLENRSF